MEQVRTVVVVGGGTAGCTVASTLASRGFRVHVVEAGGEPVHQNERDFFRALRAPGASSTYLVSTTRDVPMREYTQASVLGGGSSVNAMMSLPGEAADYDEWANNFDCAGWSWSDVAPTFDALGVPSYLAGANEIGQFGEVFLNAIDGAVRAPLAWASHRVTAMSRLGSSIIDADLLELHTNTAAESLLCDAGKVTGVVLRNGGVIEADGVVVTVGALATPRLVRTLGDNMAPQVREHVGSNLQDHPAVMLSCESSISDNDGFAVTAIAVLRDTAGEAVGQMMAYNHLGNGSSQLGIGVSLLDVHSRGRVDEHGDVFFDMLSDEHDIVRMRQVLRWALDHVGSGRFASLGTWYADSAGTRCADLVSASDDNLDSWLRLNVGFQSHASGSCRMGNTATTGAVSTSGAVHGVSGVWVADASVFPRIPRANTNLPVMMVASRIAQSIAGSLR